MAIPDQLKLSFEADHPLSLSAVTPSSLQPDPPLPTRMLSQATGAWAGSHCALECVSVGMGAIF